MSYTIITRSYSEKSEIINNYLRRKQANAAFSEEVNDAFPSMLPMTEDDGDLPWIVRVGDYEITYNRILIFRDLPVYFEGACKGTYALPECCAAPFIGEAWSRYVYIGGDRFVILHRSATSYELHLNKSEQLEILNTPKTS